jgi:uncharacterized coiled-coil DUF342 family protein
MNPEDRLRDEAQEALSRISNLSFELRQRKEQTEARLEDLRKELPEALTDAAMGLVDPGHPARIKQEMRECEEFLQDYPLIDQGLEKRTARAQRKLGRAQRQADRRARYEELKAQLREGQDVKPSWVRDYAHELNLDADAEAFLIELGLEAQV